MHLPPQLALLLTLGFMVFLFLREIRGQRQVTNAVWIPVLWLVIIGSRFVSQWLDIFGIHVGGGGIAEDGSPLDAAFFGLLILSGLYVLIQRRVSLSEVVRNNRWLTIFLAYCLISILWSDFPFVVIKRWLKVLGHPIMVLLILTEPDPEEAIIQLLKRCAYVWVPISVLFIKYFPDLGRGFDAWTGAATNSGITTNKNILGLDLFITGGFFFWYFLKVRQMEKGKQRRNELFLIAIFGWMILWLLHMAQSSTSLVSVIIAGALMLFLGLRWVNPRYIGIYLLAALFIGIVAEEGFGIYAATLHLLGKSPTLTDRTLVWHDLLQIQINPILGTGFESFWLGDRLKPLYAKWWWHPNEAHNAYLETYLNLGLVGLFLLLGWFFVTYRKACRDLVDGFDWGRFRMGFLVASLFYGWTEVAFRSLDPVYFIYFLIAVDYPKPELGTASQPAGTAVAEADLELVSAKAQNPITNNEAGCHNLSQRKLTLQNWGKTVS
jgi:exopolysaccharide production protein ExoQ